MLNKSHINITRIIKFIQKELNCLPERFVKTDRATPPKRRKPDEIKNDNIKDITKNFKETDNTEELRKFLLQIAQNII